MATQDQHQHQGFQWELVFAAMSGLAYVAGLMSEFVFGATELLCVGFYLTAYFFGGFFTVREAFTSLRRGQFDVDLLMLIAAGGAAAIGRFGEGAVLLFLFSLGHSLEEYAMSRATKSISALGDLMPTTATVKETDGELREVLAKDLRVGDTVLVKPHSRIPADGYITQGATSVDQAAVTGESMPVDKVAADGKPSENSQVYAGTVNGNGAFEMTVTAAATESVISRVIAMVSEADVASSPTGTFINRFQKIYVPSVVVGVVIVLLFGVAFLKEPFNDSFYRAMVILVAASPCALAIATPAAVLSAIARAARVGVLVKGGAPLELFGRVDTIAFDKTGTLTWGQPSVTEVYVVPGQSEAQLVSVAVAVEALSDHPLAQAISMQLGPQVPAEKRLDATGLEAAAGRGVSAYVDGQKVLIGNDQLFADASMPEELQRHMEVMQESGQTIMVVKLGENFLGIIGLMDQPRQEARETITMLRSSGIDRVVMLSGDHQRVVGTVAAQTGVDVAAGGLLPEDKVSKVGDLCHDDALVCVVGDGVNDAPAMARASLGVAMGAAASAVALEAADIALMSNDLGKLPFVRRLSVATTRTIRQNLLISLGIVAFLVPASLIGLAIGPVVIIHEGSTLLVILNSLRLLGFDKNREHEGIAHEESPRLSTLAR